MLIQKPLVGHVFVLDAASLLTPEVLAAVRRRADGIYGTDPD